MSSSDPRALGDRYEIVDRIAMGGMGMVYRARDRRLGREVAVKLLRDEMARDARFVERFRREARAVALLSHSQIASVYDYGEDAGRHFIVMELAHGEDLAALIAREGRMEPTRAAAIGAQVCDALTSAHGAGVVHRDIKPSNIVVAPDGSVKVTDFGIARAAAESPLTAEGDAMGTPHYMAPEQLKGEPVGPPADIYSLGVVLYEMVTGARPFEGGSAMGVAMARLQRDVPAPSETPGVSAELDDIVRKATARDPDARFASAADLGRALRAAASGDATAVMGGEGATAVVGASGGDTAVLTGASAAPAEPTDVWPRRTAGAPTAARREGRGLRTAMVVLGLLALLIAGGVVGAALLSGDEAPASRDRGGRPAEQPVEDPPAEQPAEEPANEPAEQPAEEPAASAAPEPSPSPADSPAESEEPLLTPPGQATPPGQVDDEP